MEKKFEKRARLNVRIMATSMKSFSQNRHDNQRVKKRLHFDCSNLHLFTQGVVSRRKKLTFTS